MAGTDPIVGGPRGTPVQPSNWWQTPAGQALVDWEQQQFDTLLVDVFGFHAVQLGLAQWPTLRANRMSHQLVVDSFDLVSGGEVRSIGVFGSLFLIRSKCSDINCWYSFVLKVGV